jgi:hypothetical protein
MGENEALDAYESCTTRERYSQCALIRSCENLHAERYLNCSPHLVTDHGERSDDFRADRSFEVRAVVGVLDHHPMEASRRVHTRLGHRGLCDLPDALVAPRCAGQPAGMDDAYECLWYAEDRVDHA